jgi:hypothetical protein
LRVFENKVPRRIFGSKREELTGRRRELHDEGLHNLYSSPNIGVIKARRIICIRHVAPTGELRNTYIILAES